MPTEFKVTRTEVKERYFTCERCGAYGEVEFHAVGEGGWVKESFWEDDAAGRSAQQAADDLQVDADRVVAMIRCPACEQRQPGAFTGAYLRIGAPTLAGAIAPFLGAHLIVFSVVMWAVAVWLLWRELKRLGRANRAEILKLKYPEKEPATKSTKPGAKSPTHQRAAAAATKAIAAKPVTAPAPIVPIRTSAPEIVQPRGPEDGPGFLK